MMKYRVVCLFVAVAASIGLATAQNSQVHSSSAKSGPDPLQTATKPLTPKSAMSPQHKSSATVPSAPTTRKTNAELSRLERQNIKAGGSKKAAKAPSVPKPAGPSNGSGSGINSTYQKPHVAKKN